MKRLKLHKLRLAKGWSREQAAALCQPRITAGTIHNWEMSTVRPNVEMLKTYLRLYGATVDDVC